MDVVGMRRLLLVRAIRSRNIGKALFILQDGVPPAGILCQFSDHQVLARCVAVESKLLIETMIRLGRSVDSAFVLALQARNAGLYWELWERTGDLDKPFESWSKPFGEHERDCALFYAILLEDWEMCRRLVDRGADLRLVLSWIRPLPRTRKEIAALIVGSEHTSDGGH